MPSETFHVEQEQTPEQKAAEQAALEQGERLEQAFQEDREQRYNNAVDSNDLIGGKFKTQEDLLKAYEESQKKITELSNQDEESGDDESEAPEGEEPNEVQPTPPALAKAAEEYQNSGELTAESIDALSQMDSKDLIEAYVDFYTKNAAQQQQAVQLQQAETQQIMDIAGGEKGYQEMLEWAATSLDPQEIDAFNSVTNSGNVPSIRFAVEALNARYQAANGYEGQMLTGQAPSDPGLKPFRSNAELSRALADPRWRTDDAYRQDVEARVANSPALWD